MFALFSKLSHSLYHTVLILVSFEKSYWCSSCSLTSTIHLHRPCGEQKSSSAGMGCVDTSLSWGKDPNFCCIALTRMRNEGQPGSNRAFFHKIDSKDQCWKRDSTNPTESFTSIPTGRKGGGAEDCTLHSLIYQSAYLWCALIWVRGKKLYLAANIWKINATTPEMAESWFAKRPLGQTAVLSVWLQPHLLTIKQDTENIPLSLMKDQKSWKSFLMAGKKPSMQP